MEKLHFEHSCPLKGVELAQPAARSMGGIVRYEHPALGSLRVEESFYQALKSDYERGDFDSLHFEAARLIAKDLEIASTENRPVPFIPYPRSILGA